MLGGEQTPFALFLLALFGPRFESQAPHHLKPLGKGVYRAHNGQQILVTNDIDHPVTVGLPCNSISCAYPDFLCQHEFVYCHPSKAEECLRLGWHELLPKVSFKGKEPTGNWSFHEFLGIVVIFSSCP